jgi:hypothetical protein
MRVDTAVVETNIQYPTHGSMLGEAPCVNATDEEDHSGAGELGT